MTTLVHYWMKELVSFSGTGSSGNFVKSGSGIRHLIRTSFDEGSFIVDK